VSDMKRTIIRIGNVADIGRGSSPRPITDKKYFENGEIPWIKIADATASGKNIYITKEYVNDVGASYSRKMKPGTLILSASGVSLGIPHFLGVEGCIHDGWIYMDNIHDIDKQYLYYLLLTMRPYFDNLSYGAAIQNINTTILSKTKIEVPGIQSQEKIGLILSAYDNLIENNNKRIKLLEQMAENLYKEWFVRFRFPGYEHVEFENGIPKGWEILRANQLFDITVGKTPDRKIFEYFSNIPECNYPWISISDMRSASTFVFKTKEYLTFNAVNTCNVKIIPKNTVLVSFKLTVGQVAITTSDMCTNEAIAHFTTDNTTMREYIYLYLKKFQYSDLGNTSSIGTAVNSKIIKNMKIILPSSELLNRFHDDVYSIFEEIRLLNETNSNLTKQRDMLLPRLMSGKLEV